MVATKDGFLPFEETVELTAARRKARITVRLKKAPPAERARVRVVYRANSRNAVPRESPKNSALK